MTTPRQVFAMGLLATLCVGAAPVPTPGDIALEYHGLPACPDETALRERTADMFHFRDPFVGPGTPASLVMRITLTQDARKSPRGSPFHADIEVIDTAGVTLARTSERHVNCDALVWVLSHRMRLAIPSVTMANEVGQRVKALERKYDQLEVKTRKLEEESSATRRSIAALEKHNNALAGALERQRRRNMDWTFALSAGALMTANLTSNVGPGVWLGGDARGGPLVLGVELRSALPAEVVAGANNFDLSHYMALAVPCIQYSIAFGCAVGGVGLELAHDSNFSGPSTSPATQPAFLAQLGGRLGVEIPLGASPLAIRGWAEALYSPTGAEFNYFRNNVLTDRVVRPDISAFFGLGVVYLFEQ